MFNIIKNEALQTIEKALTKLDYPIPDEIKLEIPPNPQLGDLATTISFQLAKVLKKNPMLITADICQNIDTPDIFSSVESKGTYINFYVDYKKFAQLVIMGVTDDYGQLDPNGEKIVLEHTSANPNGPLHIGHIRNSIIGDSLRRTLSAAGYDVETQYYVNDMGRQLAMVVWGLLNLGKKLEDYGDDKQDHLIGKLYFEVNEKLKENPEIDDEVAELIKKYESGEDEKLNRTFADAVTLCIDGVKETLKNLNVYHDDFVWEGKFVRNGDVWKIVDDLKKTKYTHEDEVLSLNLEDFGIEKELILTRSNGTSLYSTRDLAYHMEKASKGDVVLDILGSDHKLALDQVGHAMEILGAKSPEVIFYEFITLPEGSMSTRRGVFISVDDLVDEAVNRAREELEVRRNDLSDEEIDKIATEIGVGAIRYYIARLSPEKHIVFEWDEALNFERGCASIQYAHARAGKLLSKSDAYNDGVLDSTSWIIDKNWDLEEEEIDLIRVISKLPEVIEESGNIRRVHNLAQYMQDLASAFNKFYRAVPVIGSEYEKERLQLVYSSKIALKNSLNLLGISAPDVM